MLRMLLVNGVCDIAKVFLEENLPEARLALSAAAAFVEGPPSPPSPMTR